MHTTDYIGTNKSYKDRLFRLLFAEKKHGLELYNALNHTDYRDAEELEIRTLEDAIWMKMKNDVAYLIRDILSLCRRYAFRAESPGTYPRNKAGREPAGSDSQCSDVRTKIGYHGSDIPSAFQLMFHAV